MKLHNCLWDTVTVQVFQVIIEDVDQYTSGYEKSQKCMLHQTLLPV